MENLRENCLTNLFLAVSLGEGNLLSESDQIEQITHEIEQHDHLMEPNYKSEQLRIDTIKSMPQSLAAKRMIRARLLRSINRRSHLSSNSSAMRNCKFFPVIFLKKAQSWYRQAFQNCDIWYGSMKEIEGRFGSKIGVYFKILRFLVMLNFFVAVFTFRSVQSSAPHRLSDYAMLSLLSLQLYNVSADSLQQLPSRSCQFRYRQPK